MSKCRLCNPVIIALCLCLVFTAGCAVLPSGSRLSRLKQQEVEKVYRRHLENTSRCLALEAEVEVRAGSWFKNMTIPGLLQAKAPAFFKFVALNPLGQPLAVFASDGRKFQYLDVQQRTIHEGSVRSAKVQQYFPLAADPELMYFLLTGISRPELLKITDISGGPDNTFWLNLFAVEGRSRVLALFDPKGKDVTRQLLLDHDGGIVLDIMYGNRNGDDCKLAGKVLMKQNSNGKRDFNIVMQDINTRVELEDEQFRITAPVTFNRVEIK